MVREVTARQISQVFLDSPFKCLWKSPVLKNLLKAFHSRCHKNTWKTNAKTGKYSWGKTGVCFFVFAANCFGKLSAKMWNMHNLHTVAKSTNHCYNRALKSRLIKICSFLNSAGVLIISFLFFSPCKSSYLWCLTSSVFYMTKQLFHANEVSLY